MPPLAALGQRAARAAFARTMGGRAPLTNGVTTVAGVTGAVTIARDRWHVPHVTADQPDDGWFGLGFAMGQDRRFQIELLKRVAAGRVAELIGRDGLAIDRFSRRVGFHRRAVPQLAAMDADLRRGAAAFAAGINAGGTVGSPRVAHEFTLLLSTPTEFTPVDLLALFKLNAFLLAGNWETELVRLQVLLLDGEDALRRVDPSTPDALPAGLPVTAPVGAQVGGVIDRLTSDLGVLRDHLGSGSSNNWVLDGTRTASGRPLVSNDPHLPGMIPSLWYLAHVTTARWAVAGATFVGTPGFAAAHNGHGAWGTTSGHTDNTDLFLEDVRDATVRDGDDWVAAEVVRETIVVRGGRNVDEDVVITPRGPIISPALDGVGPALSLAGTWLDATPLVGFTKAVEAHDFDTFRHCFAQWPTMQLNVVWADTSGTIGWQLVGELPVRGAGHGTMPMPGWLPGVGWTGRVPFAQMPYAEGSATGFLATANNQPIAEDVDGPFLGNDFLEGYRVAAIHEVLSERDDWDVASTLDAQRDTRCLPWRAMRPAIVDVTCSGDAEVGRALLEAWDGDLAADSVGAAVYELLHHELIERVVRAAAPNAADWVLGKSASPVTDHALPGLRRTGHVIDLLQRQPDGWFAAGWDAEIAAALATVVARLRSTRGDDRSAWAWGDIRPGRLHHLVSANAAALRPIFDRGPFPLGGDIHTIPQASAPPSDVTGEAMAIASARMVVDVGDWEASRWVLPGGQSGNPASPHYDDQLALWLRGEGIPIPFAAAEVRRATVATLRLLPQA